MGTSEGEEVVKMDGGGDTGDECVLVFPRVGKNEKKKSDPVSTSFQGL